MLEKYLGLKCGRGHRIVHRAANKSVHKSTQLYKNMETDQKVAKLQDFDQSTELSCVLPQILDQHLSNTVTS